MCVWSGEWEVSWHRDRTASASPHHWLTRLPYPRDSRTIPSREHIYPRLHAQEWCHHSAWTSQRRRQMLLVSAETLPRSGLFTYLISFIHFLVYGTKPRAGQLIEYINDRNNEFTCSSLWFGKRPQIAGRNVCVLSKLAYLVILCCDSVLAAVIYRDGALAALGLGLGF